MRKHSHMNHRYGNPAIAMPIQQAAQHGLLLILKATKSLSWNLATIRATINDSTTRRYLHRWRVQRQSRPRRLGRRRDVGRCHQGMPICGSASKRLWAATRLTGYGSKAMPGTPKTNALINWRSAGLPNFALELPCHPERSEGS